MSITKIEGFKTHDGAVHESMEDATKHEGFLDLRDDYHQNRILGNQAGSYVEFKDVLDWANNNKDAILRMWGETNSVKTTGDIVWVKEVAFTFPVIMRTRPKQKGYKKYIEVINEAD